jgi:hypothetical protein
MSPATRPAGACLGRSFSCIRSAISKASRSSVSYLAGLRRSTGGVLLLRLFNCRLKSSMANWIASSRSRDVDRVSWPDCRIDFFAVYIECHGAHDFRDHANRHTLRRAARHIAAIDDEHNLAICKHSAARCLDRGRHENSLVGLPGASQGTFVLRLRRSAAKRPGPLRQRRVGATPNRRVTWQATLNHENS